MMKKKISLQVLTVFIIIISLFFSGIYFGFNTLHVDALHHSGRIYEDWNMTFGGSNIDVGHSVQQTTDSGYTIVGYTRSYGAMSGRNIWLIKTDSSGNEEWNNTFGGDADEEGYSVQQTADNGYIITGYTKSFGEGLNDVILFKTDELGNEEWNNTFGGSADEEGYSVQQTADNGYIIAGVTSSFGTGSRDVWLIKLNVSGNQEWNRTIGGFSSDGARSVQQTSDGGYILTGWTYSHDPGYLGNAWLVKTDNLGMEQWNKTFGGSDVDRGYSVKQTNDGGYILTGYTASFGSGLDDVFLIKTDDLGNEEWNTTFGGGGRDYGYSVVQTTDNGYIVTGYTLSYGSGGDDVWVIKTDELGNEIYNTTYGGTSSDVGYSIQQTSDNGYVIAGHTLSYGAGVHDVWLIKIAGNTSETTVDIELLSGWNLITVPLDNAWTAETLGENITGCTLTLMFDPSAQTFITHVVGTPWDDFPIEDGVGYFVYVTGNGSINVTGLPIMTVNVFINSSWNLIGWYHANSTTAESIGENITGCTLILMFQADTQTFLTHVIGTPWDNFAIDRGMALFVYTTESSVWQGEG